MREVCDTGYQDKEVQAVVIIGLFLNKEIRTGANRRYLELMEALARRGNRVFVAMNSLLEYQPESFVRVEICIPYVRKGFPPASFLFAHKSRRIAALIRDAMAARGAGDVEWIHIHGDMHLALAVKLKKLFGAKLFFAYRCNDVLRAHIVRRSGMLKPAEYVRSRAYEPVNRFREKVVARQANLVCFQNSADRDDWLMRVRFPLVKTVLIPGNIGLPRCRDEWKNANRATSLDSLVYVGVLSITKGLFQVFSVLHELHSRGFRNLTLAVLGKTDDADEVFQLAEKLGIEKAITWAGYTDPFPYLTTASMMIFPSLYDAFPDTILEALHTGCPVIASRRGGIPDILGNEELLFEPDDIGGMADLIGRCITDEREYRRIRAVCAERAERFRFDWPERWEHAMKEIR